MYPDPQLGREMKQSALQEHSRPISDVSAWMLQCVVNSLEEATSWVGGGKHLGETFPSSPW